MFNLFCLLRLFVNLSILSWKARPISEIHHTSLFLSYLYQVDISKWAASWENKQDDLCPSEDSHHPGHPPSLIRVFAVRRKLGSLATHWARSEDWSESLLGAQSFCWFCHDSLLTESDPLIFTRIVVCWKFSHWFPLTKNGIPALFTYSRVSFQLSGDFYDSVQITLFPVAACIFLFLKMWWFPLGTAFIQF